MSEAIVGIDVSKKDLSISLILNKNILQTNITNDNSGFIKFSKWIAKYKITKIKACMEATGAYSISFANYLYSKEHNVSIVNPVCINAFAKSKLSRHKTDKIDSLIIAEYASKHDLRPYIPKDQSMLELKDLYRCIQNLKSQKRDINNLLEHSESMSKDACRSYNKVINYLTKEVEKVEHKIDHLLEKNQKLKSDIENICTIPGVARTTAIAVLSEAPDLSLFKDARQLGAFAGLTPKHHCSGTSVKKQSRISKIGSRNLRKALYFPAIVAKNHNPLFSQFSQKLLNKGKPAKVIIIAIMRKLLHIIFGIVKNNTPFNPNFAIDS